MNVILQPWQLFFVILAGRVNRQQQEAIEYLRTENQVLRETLGKKRILGAIDFTTVEVWTRGGLVRFYLLFVMELKTRGVHFAGCTANPDQVSMKQIAKKNASTA